MSNILAIRANNSGVLQFAINTEGVRVETEWKNCVNPEGKCLLLFLSLGIQADFFIVVGAKPEGEETDEEEEEKDPQKMFTVLVSIKSFLKFLNSHVVSNTTIACELLLFDERDLRIDLPRLVPPPLPYPLCVYRRDGGQWRHPDVLHPGRNRRLT